MSTLIDSLNWRYATKQFDDSKTVSPTDLETLQNAINLTATSYGLQAFRVVITDNADIKAKLRAASYDQPQLTESSHVFVFASKLDMTEDYVDGFIKLVADTKGIPVEAVQGYADFIKGSLKGQEADFIKDWNRRQAYIAVGTLLAAAAELRVDSCPMEGFDPAQVDEILGLKEKGLTAAVIVPVGYRSAEDKTQHGPKVRLPLDEMFIKA